MLLPRQQTLAAVERLGRGHWQIVVVVVARIGRILGRLRGRGQPLLLLLLLPQVPHFVLLSLLVLLTQKVMVLLLLLLHHVGGGHVAVVPVSGGDRGRGGGPGSSL